MIIKVMRPTFARIHLENLEHNLKYIRSKISSSAKMCIAVKADAYGHGAVECARTAVKCGVDFLAVAAVSEGVELRNAGIKLPVLVLSLVDKSEIEELIKNNLTPLVYDEEYISLVKEKCVEMGVSSFPVHLAVDTGMGRIGCYPEEAGKLARFICDGEVLKFEGMCTHFAAADSLSEDDRKYTQKQFELFLEAVENVKKAGVNPGIRHCANSALTLDRSDTHLDMCRPGIIVYGYYPGELDKKYFENKGEKVFLKPVMELVTKVVSVRDFKKGGSISYGRTWTASSDTKTAVLPIGYADGLFRRFNQSNGGLNDGLKVVIKNKAYSVRGRICMDQCMVELGPDSDVKRWDEVTVFGPEECGAMVSAQEIADAVNTISYEITCGISKRVPRVFVR